MIGSVKSCTTLLMRKSAFFVLSVSAVTIAVLVYKSITSKPTSSPPGSDTSSEENIQEKSPLNETPEEKVKELVMEAIKEISPVADETKLFRSQAISPVSPQTPTKIESSVKNEAIKIVTPLKSVGTTLGKGASSPTKSISSRISSKAESNILSSTKSSRATSRSPSPHKSPIKKDEVLKVGSARENTTVQVALLTAPALFEPISTLAPKSADESDKISPVKNWNLNAAEFIPSIPLSNDTTYKIASKKKARAPSKDKLIHPPTHTLADFFSEAAEKPDTTKTKCYFGTECHNKKCTYFHPTEDCK